ncbi:MAG: PAC2 family protein, partial [Syntrophorhabdaceae bacterium]|nr:PAC2 family protein [Syntrophorhabdaceae bacterium]
LRIGGFRFKRTFSAGETSYAFATLWPWIDVNGVGTLVLKELRNRFGAIEVARFSRPGIFFDFTRYRPTIHIEDGIQEIIIPNTTIYYGKKEEDTGLMLLRMLEPHMNAELYIESVLKVFKALNVKRYTLLGSMYDAVPHTRPLIVSGYAMGKDTEQTMKRLGVLPIVYRGQSSIVNMITKKAAESGIDVKVFIVSIPQYVILDEDYIGKIRLMEVLNLLYDIPVDRKDFEKALEQKHIIDERLEKSTEFKMLLPQLESAYDMRIKSLTREDEGPLDTEMDEILWKSMDKDIGKA